MVATSCCLTTKEEKGIGPILGDLKTILSDERYYDVNAEMNPLPSLPQVQLKKIKNLRTCKIVNLKKTSNEKFGNGAVKQKSLFTLLTSQNLF